MEIKVVFRSGLHKRVQIVDANTTLDLGLLNEDECRELAVKLWTAATEISDDAGQSKLVTAIEKAKAALFEAEINLRNFDDDDVAGLNQAVIDASAALDAVP